MKSRTVWRVIDLVMVVLCAFSVIVQFNDPDPAAWVAVYVAAGVVAFLSFLGRLPWSVAALVSLMTLAWAASISPRVVGLVPFLDMFGAFEMKSTGIEESREMYGLLMLGVYTGIAAIRARGVRKSLSD